MKKRKSRREIEEIRCGILFREDLESIVDALTELAREAGESPVVKIDTDAHVFDSVAELVDDGVPALRKLTLRLREPSFWVYFEPWALRLHPSDDSLVEKGAAGRIKQIAEQTRPGLRGFVAQRGWFAFIVALGVSSWFSHGVQELSRAASNTLLFFLVFCLATAGTGLLFNRQRTIRLTKRYERQSWWERNGDKVTASVISSAITGTLAALVTWLLTKR